ncbi:MAG: NAD(+) synthase [Candidatus Heimdallarchaeota archaeon]|nr:MAG: NAD(+) synthase [Candidatus Heimdallarchaeota archaeon]
MTSRPKNNNSSGIIFDASVVCNEIADFLRSMVHNLNRDGAVVSVSGGLDSAVAATLTVYSLGAEKVHLLNMPEKDSNPIHQRHAKQLAEHLNVQLTVKSITSILKATGTYKLLPLRFVPTRGLRERAIGYGRSKKLSKDEEDILVNRLRPKANSWVAKGNAYAISKHRVRMVVLYQFAEVRNLMVVGAANRTEWLTGTFSKWGVDHCADVMPLIHVYRSNLEELAEYLQVPEFIRNKPADPDIIPSFNNKEELLGGFTTVDKILHGIEKKLDKDELCRLYDKTLVKRLLILQELSKHMRKSPYHLSTS